MDKYKTKAFLLGETQHVSGYKWANVGMIMIMMIIGILMENH
jgi:hypothetical protein